MSRITKTFDEKLSGMPAWVVATLSFLLLAVLGVMDWATGNELSSSIFYLVPVVIASWYGGRFCGMAVAVAGALLWDALAFDAGMPHDQGFTAFWNAGVRFGILTIVALLVARQRENLLREERMARMDPITGIPNSRGFHQSAAQLWERTKETGKPTSVAFLDLDNFKRVNDTLGHAAGDEVLKRAAETLARSVRAEDVIARIGGDEFVVLLPGSSADAAEKVFQRARAELQAVAKEEGWPVSMSVGVVVVNPPYPSMDETLRMADGLMYEMKREGKDRVKVRDIREADAPATVAP